MDETPACDVACRCGATGRAPTRDLTEINASLRAMGWHRDTAGEWRCHLCWRAYQGRLAKQANTTPGVRAKPRKMRPAA